MLLLSFNDPGSPEIYLDVLRAICGDTEGRSMIDLCCGFAPQTRQLGFTTRKYIDIVRRDLGSEKEHAEFTDVFRYLKHDCKRYYDVSILSDAIEHFRKEDALNLLSLMNGCSDKQVVFTPLGNYLIEQTETDHPDTHKSGWTPKKIEFLFPGKYSYIEFPNFHPTLGIGAFFFWSSPNITKDFQRVYNHLKQYQWTKLS